jgi:HD-like signal output (HDOD) protein
VLSAQILRLANSAIFARLKQVASVRHAVAMIGIGTLRKFALGSFISNLFSCTKQPVNFSMMRFNVHSVATAILVELMADEIPFESAGDAFLAGLLHDVGKLLIAVSLPQQYDDILALAAVNGCSLLECERAVLGIDHAELSGLAVSRWDLPEAVQAAVWYHHEPEKSDSIERRRPKKVGLSLGVHRADAFVSHLGLSVLPAGIASHTSPTLEIPGFTFSEERVLQRFEQEIQNLGDLFR